MNPVHVSNHQAEAQLFEQYVQMGDALYRKHFDFTCPFNYLEQAINEYSKALELNPDATDLLAKLARVYLRTGNYKKAQELSMKALAKDNTLSDAHYVLGNIRYKENAFQASINCLEKAVQTSGLASSRFRFCLYYSYQGASKQQANPLHKTWLWTLSAYQFISGMALIPFNPEPLQLFQLVGALPGFLKAYFKELGSDKEGALAEYRKLHEKFLGLPQVMNLIASSCQRRGLLDEAQDWLQKAISRDPLNEQGYYQMANLLEERGELNDVLKIYQKLLAISPMDAQVHCSLGNVYSMLNEYDDALIHYKAALELGDDPEWQALIAQTLASLYQEIQKNAEAATLSYQLAIQLNPKEVNNYINLGILYFEKGDFDNSQIVYEQALRLCPENPRIHSNLGYLKWLKGDIQEAVRYYETAIELDPFYDIPHNNLGVIHLDVLGNVSRAIELIEKSIKLNERYALAYYNLGRAHIFLDNKLEAAKCFQKAQVLNEFTRELDNEELTARLNNLFNSFES